MGKILSQAGNSLADVYDVEGSIAGIEHLETHDLPIVHEMGATVFSERFSTDIRRATSGALAQNTAWDVVVTNLATTPFRILGVVVFALTANRANLASVAVRDPLDGRELPIWLWDSNADVEVQARLSDDGGAVATVQMLRPGQILEAIPHLTSGADQPQPVNEIAFRGLTLGFGAGTVETIMLLHNGFSQVGGISSRGLPIPSW